MSQISIAVIGGGRLGKIHARLLKSIDAYQVVAVVETNHTTRAAIESELGLKTIESLEQLETPIEAAVIATPTSHHLETAMWCLERNIHCFVEKPLVRSSRQAALLGQMAQSRKLTLQVGHVERFNPAWQALKHEIDEPIWIEAHRSSTYTGRSTDIGVVFDLMIHDLDLVLDAIDSPVVSVTACGLPVLGQFEDWAEARLHFENGACANLYASRVSRVAERSMRMMSETFTADIDFAKGQVELIRPCDEVAQRRFQADRLPEAERLAVQQDLFTKWLPHQSLTTTPVNAIEMELREFAEAIQTSKAPRVDGFVAQRVIATAEQVIDAIHESMEKRRVAREAAQIRDIIPAAHRFSQRQKRAS